MLYVAIGMHDTYDDPCGVVSAATDSIVLVHKLFIRKPLIISAQDCIACVNTVDTR